MIRTTLLSRLIIVFAFLPASAAAESIEAARAAFSAGEYVEAADLGEALGTASGHALAAEALAIYAHYVAEEEAKAPLLQALRCARRRRPSNWIRTVRRPIFSWPTPRAVTPSCSRR